MKKALIVKEPFMGREVGQIENIGEASFIDSINNRFLPKMEKVAIPESWGDLPIKVLILQAGESVSEYWFKGEEILYSEPTVTAWELLISPGQYVYEDPQSTDYQEVTVQDPTYTKVDAIEEGMHLVIDWEKHFDNKIAEAKAEMNQAIYNEVFTYFGTSDREAAATWESSWRLKATRATDYVNDSLFVIHTTTNFPTAGQPLTTETEISDYYNELLNERVVPFDKFRDLKVAQFIATQTALLTKKANLI